VLAHDRDAEFGEMAVEQFLSAALRQEERVREARAEEGQVEPARPRIANCSSVRG
jgi:hypothetical protein